jgi:hypothetical protein
MINFGPWEPDKAVFQSIGEIKATGFIRCQDVNNVVPSVTGPRPFPSFFNVTSAITARAQGAFTTRGLQGTIFNFCGDVTNLYLEASDGLSWTDISRAAGGDYAVASDGWWDFGSFGDYVIATDGVDVPQYYQMDVSAAFALLAGSPPTASFFGVIREFGVLARHSTARHRLTWSAISDIADWAASATTLSDSQDFQDGGQIMGFVGGEFGIVLLERGIWRMAFEGPPTAFRFDKIANFLGCDLERSIAAYENLIFWKAPDGFYMIRGGSEIIPIGDGKVDLEFADTLDANYRHRVSSAIDPVRKLYLIGFPSGSASSGTPDSIWAYHWPTGQWSKIAHEHEIIYIAATQTTYTIDGMDAASGTIDGLPYPVDSSFWAGQGHLLPAAFNTDHEQGFYTGTSLAATIETSDTQLVPGKKSLLQSLRPMVEGSSVTPSVAIKYRDRLQDAHSTGSTVAANSNGVCNVRRKARYHRAVMTIPAGDTWVHATGLDDIKFKAMGSR